MATSRRNIAKAIVQYDFNPVEAMEVAVSKHEMVKIIQEHNGWICVEKSNGQIGYIPISFCKIIKSSLMKNVNNMDKHVPSDITKEADTSNSSFNSEDRISDTQNANNVNETTEAKEFKIQQLKSEYRERLPTSTSSSGSTESRSRSLKRSNEHSRRSRSLTSIDTPNNQNISRQSSVTDLNKTISSTDLSLDWSKSSSKVLPLELSPCPSPTEIVQNAVSRLSPRAHSVKTVREVFPNVFGTKSPQHTDVPASSGNKLPGKLLLCHKEQCIKDTRRSTVDSEVNCVCDCHVIRKVKSIVGNDLDFIKDKIKNNLNLLEHINEDDIDRVHNSYHGDEKTISSCHGDTMTPCATCGSKDDGIYDPYSVDKNVFIGSYNMHESLNKENYCPRNHISSNDSGYSEVIDSDTYSQISDSNIGNDSFDNCSDQQLHLTPSTTASHGGCYGDVAGCANNGYRDNSDISDESSEFDVANGPEYFIDDVCTEEFANSQSENQNCTRNIGQIGNYSNGPSSILTKPSKGSFLSHREREPQTGFYLKMDGKSGIIPATCNISYGRYTSGDDSTSYSSVGRDTHREFSLPRGNKYKKRVHFEIDCNEYII